MDSFTLRVGSSLSADAKTKSLSFGEDWATWRDFPEDAEFKELVVSASTKFPKAAELVKDKGKEPMAHK